MLLLQMNMFLKLFILILLSTLVTLCDSLLQLAAGGGGNLFAVARILKHFYECVSQFVLYSYSAFHIAHIICNWQLKVVGIYLQLRILWNIVKYTQPEIYLPPSIPLTHDHHHHHIIVIMKLCQIQLPWKYVENTSHPL